VASTTTSRSRSPQGSNFTSGSASSWTRAEPSVSWGPLEHHLLGESSVHRVPGQQFGQLVGRGDVIDRHHLERRPFGDGNAHQRSPHAAEPVDPYANVHWSLLDRYRPALRSVTNRPHSRWCTSSQRGTRGKGHLELRAPSHDFSGSSFGPRVAGTPFLVPSWQIPRTCWTQFPQGMWFVASTSSTGRRSLWTFGLARPERQTDDGTERIQRIRGGAR